jgi:hypothetical protein
MAMKVLEAPESEHEAIYEVIRSNLKDSQRVNSAEGGSDARRALIAVLVGLDTPGFGSNVLSIMHFIVRLVCIGDRHKQRWEILEALNPKWCNSQIQE